MKKHFNHVLLSNIIDSLKIFLIAIGIATSVAQGAVESSNEAESSPIRFESRSWAEAVMSAASASDSIIIEGGRLKANAVWAPPKTHLVFNSVYVPKGITLTIVTNCVVKFCEGTFIKVEDGGTLNIVGEEGKEVILTAANDNTVGTTVPELDPEKPLEFKGIVLQSSAAKFTDNGWLEIRGFVCSLFPSISISNQTVYRSTGHATIPITVTGTRKKFFMIDWAAEDGTAKFGKDYTVASGSITWENTGTKKNIEIPILKDHITGSNTTFTIKILAARGASVIKDTAIINISEMISQNIDSAIAESSPIRVESRSWAEAVYNTAITNEMIIIEGGRLEEDVIWAPPETHLVFNTVYVPSGITLTIVTNTVVKFCEGTFIKVEDGGKLNIVGAEDEDIILTAANDNTVGEPIIGLDPDQTIEFPGIILQSSNATLTDNGWLQNKGFKISGYPSISLADVEVFRSTGLASVKVSISGTRYQSFSIDWEAEDVTATLSNDYIVASGRLTWTSTSEGSKNIEIPLVVDHNVGSNTTFKVKVTTARGININNGECTVTIKELDVNTFNFEYDSEESASIRFESRPWAKAVMDAASTNNMIVLEGGRLKKNTTWGPPKTHLVFNSVYVPNGITLTIVTNAVVKFCEGTFIKVEDGGKLNITGAENKDVILTAANDDTAGKTIPGLDPKETIVFKGIVFSSNNATFTDNCYLETRGFSISRYPTLTLHEATANRNSGVIYIPITINSINRNQRFSVDWVAEDGSAKFEKDYTLASGHITWANSYEGKKDIEIPIVKDHIVGDNATFTVRFSALYGVNADVNEITVTIAEFKSGELTSDTVVELNDSELSPSTPVDEGIQLRPFFLNDVETIRYSGKWQKYDTSKADKLRVTVESDNGLSILKEAAPSEEGSFELKVSDYPEGFYTLKHEIVDAQGTTLATMQKSFSVLDADKVEMHGGTLTQNEVWTSNKVHVVYATVYVPTIYTLFIEPGTIVKFVKGTGIKLLGEAAFFANGIVFTNIDDDTVGGDTLNDGYTGKPPIDAYFLKGNFHFSGDTELRNVTQPEVLTGKIKSDKILNRGGIYRVSGLLNVVSGGSLTILPGTILKMESGASITIDAGAFLDVKGTRSAPVVITSIKDDSVGGDTNKDGDKTTPQPGDWCCIKGHASFEYTSILYGGYGQSDTLRPNGGMVFNNSTLAHTLSWGVSMDGAFAMTNSIFRDVFIGFRHQTCTCVNSVFYNMTHLSNNGSEKFINCIIANYATSIVWWDSAWGCEFNNCVIWNPKDFGPQDAENASLNGNIWGDPLFVDPENGDFRILENSPCVDNANSKAAPEVDYFGQRRITVTDQGTNTVEQLADIGIYEVVPRDLASDIDLIPQNVRSDTNAVSGQPIFVKWEILNAGGQEIKGSWRDTISFVSESGCEVVLGDKTTTSTIGAGGAVFCSGYFYVPAMTEGDWHLKVNVNSYHDIFEGSLIANNSLVGDRPVTISVESFDASVSRSGSIKQDVQNVFKLSFDKNDKNCLVSFNLPKGARITWGFGSVPISGAVIPGVSGSSISAGTVPVKFCVPEGITEVFIVIESDAPGIYDFSTAKVEFDITDVIPSRISNKKTSTVEINGVAISTVNKVFLRMGTQIIDGEITSKNDDKLIVVFSPNGSSKGNYELVFETFDGQKTIGKGITVFSNARGAEIKIDFETPETFRAGRWNVATIRYKNIGEEETTSPIIALTSKTVTFKNPDDSNETYKNAIHLLGLADTDTPTILRPGESGVIHVPFQVMTKGTFIERGSYYIGVNKSIPGIDSLGLDRLFAKGDKTDAVWEEFLGKMRSKFGTDDAVGLYNFIISDVATCARLGRKFYCIEPFMNAAIHLANDEDRTIVAATLYDADNKIVTGHDVFSVSDNAGIVRKGTSNNNGRAVFYDAGDDWEFMTRESNEIVETISVSTNAPVYDVSLGLEKLVNVSSIETISNLFPQVNNTLTYNMKLLPVELSYTPVAWVDALGVFNIGKFDGTNLVSLASESFEVRIRDWRVQETNGNTLTLFVYGTNSSISKIYSQKITINEDSVNLFERKEFTFDYEIDSPIWNGKNNITFIDEHGRILVHTNVVLTLQFDSTISDIDFDTGTWSFGGMGGVFAQGNLNFKGNKSTYSLGCCRLGESFDFDTDARVYCIAIPLPNDWEISANGSGNSKYWCGGYCEEDKLELLYQKLHFFGKGDVGQNYSIAFPEKLNVGLLMKSFIQAVGRFSENQLMVLFRDAGFKIDSPNEIYEWFDKYAMFASVGAGVKLGGIGSVELNHLISSDLIRGDLGIKIGPNLKIEVDVINSLVPIVYLGVNRSIFQVDAGVYKSLNLVDTGTGLKDSMLASAIKTYQNNNRCYLTMDLLGTIHGKYNFKELKWEFNPGLDQIFNARRLKAANYPAPKNTTMLANSYTDENGSDRKNSDLVPGPDGGMIYKTPKLNDDGTDSGTNIPHFRDKDGNENEIDPNIDIIGQPVKDNEGMWVPGVNPDPGTGEIGVKENTKEGTKLGPKRPVTKKPNVQDAVGASTHNGRVLVVTTCPPVQPNEPRKIVFSIHRRKYSSDSWNEYTTITNMFGNASIVDISTSGKIINVLIKEIDNDGNEKLLLVKIDENLKIISIQPYVANTVVNKNNSLTSVEENSYINFFQLPKSVVPLENPDGCDANCTCGCGKGKCLCPPDCPHCNGDCVECHCGGGDGGDEITSGDPNEMSGPLGIGDPETERFVVPGEWLTYTVYFENTSNATAAAQEVYVTNPLNKYLDWSTFEMGDIAFNNQIDLGLAGKQSGTSEVAANGESYNVRTQLELDKEKGEAKWYMRIVDPSTETGWPDDILVGFLPPNDETYRGEGHLSYRIKVREDAPAGVTINNSATIVFDYNDPIETDPAWWNKVAQTQKVSFDDGSTNVNLVVGMPYGKLPVPGERKGWTFVGWFTGPDGTGRQITEDSIVEEGDDMLYQHWVRNKHDLIDDDKGMAVASVYDGYVYDPVENRTTKGSIQAKVGKTKNGKAKVSATIVMAGGEKTEIKGEMDTATGTLTATAKNGRPVTLTFGENDLSGTYGEFEIDGARNLFVSKNGNDQATANAALAAWGGVHTMVWDDGPGYAVASISIGSKGKTKVVGWMGNGTKFSASGQLIVGKKESCVTIVSTNNRTPLAFNLWFEAGEETEFEGISDYAIISTVGPLVPDAFFMCGFLTESVPIVIQKGKWTVNTSKETALKLSYKDKTGTFKGSFKVNKQKAIVNGVVVDGVGYGSAVMKNAGFMPVVIDSVKEE